MGQALGLPQPFEGVKTFTNCKLFLIINVFIIFTIYLLYNLILYIITIITTIIIVPREAIDSIWTAYNLFGEGWGLDLIGFSSIIRGADYLNKYYNYSDDSIETLFNSFDTDNNGLIDALELFMTIALMSGMDDKEKIKFAFTIYDFQASDRLSIDELILLLNSAVKGIAKVFPTQYVFTSATVVDVEQYSSLIFGHVGKSIDDQFIIESDLSLYCLNHPVIGSWLKHFSFILPSIPFLSSGSKNLGIYIASDFCSNQVVNAKFSSRQNMSALSLSEGIETRSEYLLKQANELAASNAQREAEKAFQSCRVQAEQLAQANGITVFAAAKASGIDLIGTAKAAGVNLAELYEVKKKPAPLVPDENGGVEVIDPPLATSSIVESEVIETRPWFEFADVGKPDEMPTCRLDTPEDTLDSLWTHGYSGHVKHSASYDANGNPFFVASRHVVKMSKNEEGAWGQTSLSNHQYPITCMATSSSCKILVTGDMVSSSAPSLALGESSENSKLVFWNLETNTVSSIINIPDTTASGIQSIDFSGDEKHVLVVLVNNGSCRTVIYNVATQSIVHSKVQSNQIFDAKFLGSSCSSFSTASNKGVHFFIEEAGSFVGDGSFKSYDSFPGLYQDKGAYAIGNASTCLCKFTGADELLSGSDSGQLLFWRGKSCFQLLDVHSGPITEIIYQSSCKTIATSGIDGKINLIQLQNISVGRPSSAVKKGPKVVTPQLLQIMQTFDISVNAGLLSVQISSISLNDIGSKILVGTLGGDVMELSCLDKAPEGGEEEPVEVAEGEAPPVPKSLLGSDINGGPLVQSHWRGTNSANNDVTITGLCKAPGGFVSCGLDGSLRLWAAAEGAPQKLLKSVAMDAGCVRIASSPTHVAVALNDVGNAERIGSVHVFTLPELTFMEAIKISSQIVTDIVFSGDGVQLAAAAGDNNIYIYAQAEGKWTSKGDIRSIAQPQCPSLRMDFASDGAFLRMIDTAENFRIVDIVTAFGVDCKDPALVKAMTWASNNCPCSWDLKGLWNGVVDCNELANIDRSQHLMVTASTNGTMNLTRVPALKYHSIVPAGNKKTIPIHCGSVKSAVFIEEGARLVTAGGSDGLIRVWKVNYDMEELELEPEANPDDEVVEETPEDGDAPPEPKIYDSAEDEDMFDGNRLQQHLTRQVSSNDPISAIKPWISKVGLQNKNVSNLINLMSNNTKVIPDTPNDELELAWVHGYASRISRGSVHYSQENDIVYPAATVNVIYDKVNATQRHIMAHCDEVICCDVHVGLGVGVSSHKGAGNIESCVWNTKTGAILSRLNCGVVNGVSAVAFSPNGKLVAAACQDYDHTVKIFNWSTGQLLSSYGVGNNKVLSMAFSLNETGNVRICCGGIKHFVILEMRANRIIDGKNGLYGAGIAKSNVLSICALPVPLSAEAGGNEFAIGMSDGTMGTIALGDRRVVAFTPVQSGSVTAVRVVKVKDATIEEPPVYKIVTGGVDGHIKVWSQEMEEIAAYNLYKGKIDYGLYKQGKVRGIKSLCIDKANWKILYGTSAGEIGEISIENGANVNEVTSGPLVTSHFKDELRGLATHPIRQECLTAGDDKTLRVWDLENHYMATMIELPDVARAAAYAPNGQVVLAGLGGNVLGETREYPRSCAGQLVVMSYLQGVLLQVHVANDANDAITSIAFNPDGSQAYCSSLDKKVYVYDALSNFSLTRTLIGATEGIRSLDICSVGKYILTNGVNGETILWDGLSGAQVNAANIELIIKNISWLNQSGVCAKNTYGIFPSGSNCGDINTLCKSNDNSFIATGDKFGSLKLFSNPSKNLYAPSKQYVGHTPGGIAKVCFSKDDKYLLSIGSDDKTILQWKVIKNTIQSNSVEVVDQPEDVAVVTEENKSNFMNSLTINNVNFAGNDNVDQSGSVSFDCCVGSSSLSSSLYNSDGNIVTSYGDNIIGIERDRISANNWPLPSKSGSINSLVVSTCGRLTVSGNDAGSVTLYDSSSKKIILELSNDIIGGVAAVAISSNNKMIACLGKDSHHSLYVFTTCSNWELESTLFFKGPVGTENIYLLTFLNTSTADNSDLTLITSGDDTYKFWSIRARNMMYSIGQIDSTSNSEHVAAGSAVSMTKLVESQYSIIGDSNGFIWVWNGLIRQSLVGSHSGSVSSLTSWKNGFITASNDSIKLWSYIYTKLSGINSFTLESEIPLALIYEKINRSEFVPAGTFVTCVSVDKECRRLLISLSAGLLVEYSVDSGSVLLLSEGTMSPTVCTSSHPTEANTLITGHDDNTIRVWDTSKPRLGLTSILRLPHTPAAISFKDSNTLVIATIGCDTNAESNSLLLVSLSESIPIASNDETSMLPQVDKTAFSRVFSIVAKVHNVGKGAVTALRVSSDSSKIAVCTSDGYLSLYKMNSSDEPPELLSKKYKCISLVHQNEPILPVVGVDFSVDGKYIRTFGPSSGISNSVLFNIFDINPEERSNENDESFAQLVTDSSELQRLTTLQWSSVSSPAASEAVGSMRPDANITSFSNNDTTLAVSYSDNISRVYRLPVSAIDAKPIKEIKGFYNSSQIITSGNNKIFSVGVSNGFITTHNIE
jgi:microtubule-associated protein-like 6